MKKLIFFIGIAFYMGMLCGQVPRHSFNGDDERRVADLLEVLQHYSKSSSEPRSVGLYQIDSILQGHFDEETGQFSKIFYKNYFQYTDRGFPEEATFYEKQGEVYKPYSKYRFDFSQNGQIEQFLWQYWDRPSAQWMDYVQNVFFYDAKRQLSESIYSEANYSGTLQPSSRMLYQYNEAGQLISRLDQVFVSDHWMNQFERIYTYNEQSDQSSFSYWTFDSSVEPLEIQRIYYHYNSLHQPTLEVNFTYNYYFFELSLQQKDTFIYDHHGKLIKEVTSQYPSEGQWLVTTQVEYSYRDSDIPRLIQHSYQDEEGEWKLLSKSEINMNLNRDIISYVLFSYQKEEDRFLQRSQRLFSRAPKIRLENLNYGSLIWLDSWVLKNLAFNGAEKGTFAIDHYDAQNWDAESNAWISSDESGGLFFYYSRGTLTSNKNPVVTPVFEFYPNPTSRWLMLELPPSDTYELFLYDLFGRQLFRRAVTGQEQIILPALPEGTYILQLNKGREIIGSRRLMIRR